MLPIIYSKRFLKHLTGIGHPECPERLTAIYDALLASNYSDQLRWIEPSDVTRRDPLPWIYKLHDRQYVQAVEQLARHGGGHWDADTVISADSYDVALLAVNAWLDGVDQMLGNDHPAFVLARPPGHHALRAKAMGFCLFSNASIAAHYALEQPNIERVAILDWDVHHGNGTQALIENNPQIAYCSFHQSPCYPGTGSTHEQGQHNNVLNLPMNAGSTIDDYLPQCKNQAIPFLSQFAPDLLIVSAGYDATQADPLAGINLQAQDYGALTAECLHLTRRILFGLEGGYCLDVLGQSVLSTLAACQMTKRGGG